MDKVGDRRRRGFIGVYCGLVVDRTGYDASRTDNRRFDERNRV